MKKTDLIELLKDIADDGDINEKILGTDEFKGLKDLSKLTADDIKGVLTGEVGKAYMTSHDDSVRSKAVETFKNGKMQDEIKKAIEESKNETKSPEQIEIEKLKKQFEESQAELTKERNTAKYSKLLKDKGLPTELVDFVYGDGSEEIVNKNIDTISGIIKNAVDTKVNAKMEQGSYNPPDSTSTNTLNSQIANAMGVK